MYVEIGGFEGFREIIWLFDLSARNICYFIFSVDLPLTMEWVKFKFYLIIVFNEEAFSFSILICFYQR